MSCILCLMAALGAVRAPVEAPRPVAAVVAERGAAFVAGRSERVVVLAVTTPAGRRVWGFGSLDRDGHQSPPDGRTLFEIGSVTKTLTGTLLADLTRDGIVRVDGPLRDHLPADWAIPTRDGRDITLLHLATHTSSLPRLPPGLLTASLLTLSPDDPYRNFGAEAVRTSLVAVRLDRPIGSRYEYSNLGVGLLGFALAHADDTTVTGLFRDRLTGPLGMPDTVFDPDPAQIARLAAPFRADGRPGSGWTFSDPFKAAGGLRSTADDLLTYAEAALSRTDTPLRPAFASAMQSWRQIDPGRRAIGLGWHLENFTVPATGRTMPLIVHEGATGGYRAAIALLPDRHAAAVILSNSDAPLTAPLLFPILRALAAGP